ncbi:hypothetical protein [Botrimarina hoheduenensis]|uniref:Uncharacterized protein n=1 Tax=Botrimarina hoheduenensis TaxID=2528000 RepID=A0A5C5VUQ8_9BACT|nr:hypothetical protein [Botrimarina hoheduenensis]TWT41379.1 hypothetical protein Pla111_30930 [Botrimarina hoheduenensis]
MSKVSVREAALLTGKSRETINAATKSGKLSSARDGTNRKLIDVSELERVYPLVKTIDQIQQPSEPVKPRQVVSESDVRAEVVRLSERLAASEAMQDNLIAERSRERRQLEDEIANLRENLARAQEQHSKALLLITDQSQQASTGGGDWERSIKALEKRLANHEEQVRREREKNEEAERKLERYKRALHSERNKSLWKKLFG